MAALAPHTEQAPATLVPAQPGRELTNEQVAAVFDEIADLLEVQGANTFRIRAYRAAARELGGMGHSVAAMVRAGEDLDALRGIGKDLAQKIAEICAGGTCAQLESLRRETAPGVAELLQLPGLGPRRVQKLHEALGIASLAQLQAAAEEDRIRSVPGFGATAQQRLLDAVRQHLRHDRRFPVAMAAEAVATLLAQLQAVQGVRQAVAAGSFRRRRETVGDVDLLATTSTPARAMHAFTRHSGVTRVLAEGTTRASVLLAGGLQVDLRVVRPSSFGAAWMYFTGSKAHNIALRRIAQDAGLKLNEYGLWRESRRIAGATEADVYKALGLPWIAPELREDNGEIEAAREGRLPQLVELADLQGDLHVHHASALGSVGLRALADAAIARKLRYLAVASRLRPAGGPHGVDAAGLALQAQAIARVNEGCEGFTLLHALEAQILEDGRLDLPRGLDLSGVDMVIGVVDAALDLPAAKQTARLQRAMDHRAFSMLAHPTNRLLLRRAPCAFDLERVLRHARDRGCFVELDARPDRLDLDDVGCRMAREIGVPVAVCSQAEDARGFENLLWGVGQARRGWLEPGDVVNTRPLSRLRALLAATMGRAVHAAD